MLMNSPKNVAAFHILFVSYACEKKTHQKFPHPAFEELSNLLNNECICITKKEFHNIPAFYILEKALPE